MNNITIRTYGIIFLVAVVVVGVLLVSGTLVTRGLADRSAISWEEYQDNNSERALALDTLVSALGYGGIIHQFKNYILRHDPAQANEVRAAARNVLDATRNYRSQGVNEGEEAALQAIELVTNAYVSQLAVARELATDGATAEEIDAVVRVSDGPAFEALETLASEISSAATQQATALSVNMKTVSRLSTFLLVFTVLSVLVAMVMGYLLMFRVILNPIRLITDTMRRLADGDTDVKVEEAKGRCEIDNMKRAVKVFQDNFLELQGTKEQVQEESKRYVELAERTYKLKEDAEKSAARFELLADHAAYAIGILSKSDNLILYANDHLEKHFGKKVGDTHVLFEREFDDELDYTVLARMAFEEEGQVLNEEICIEMGSIGRFWGLLTVLPIEYDGKDCYYVSVNDITSHKEYEASLLEMQTDLEIKATEESVLAELLSLGMADTSRDDFLQSTLDMLVGTIPWLRVTPKGAIFLTETEDNVDRLKLTAIKEFPSELLSTCAEVPLGHCLCGRAAQGQEIMHSSCMDERHENRFDGMEPHGLYNVPMIVQGRTIGVIVFYLPHGHERSESEVAFLKRVANVVAMGVERREADQELRKAKIDAEDASTAKSAFLASMSHEIRTPMNGVLGMAELMLMSDLPKEIRQDIEIIQESGNGLLEILNDILDLSKVEAGKVVLEEIDVDVLSVIRSASSLVRDQFEYAGLWFDEKFDEDLVAPRIKTDPTRLRQVLTNLLSNAKKFTHEGGIEVSLSQQLLDNGQVETRIAVTDTGIGMTEDQVSRVFQAFQQADQSTTRQYGGTGLGLSLCKQLTELMGGDIGVSSTLGEGSTFWFSVVCDVVEESAPATVPMLPEASEEPGPVASGLPNLLVAEDNLVNQKIIKKILGAIGYPFDIVANGQEALEALPKGAYDLILMDVNMPVLDGIDATRLIRKLPAPNGQIPIIALTANAMKGDREKYLAAGMNDYVAKPISPAKLYEIISKYYATSAPESNDGEPSQGQPQTKVAR